jgi:hypothetical protein
MNMLTRDDLQQIGELMDDKLGNMVEQLLFPKFDEIDTRLERLEAKVESLPTKDFVTEKIGELRGEMVLGFRRQEARTDQLVGELAQVLKEKDVITPTDVARVDAVRLCPRQIG